MRKGRVKNVLTALTLCLALGFCATARIEAEARAVVELSADLLEAFGAAHVTNASSCELRRPASANGVKQDALFEHPVAPGRPARVSYSLNLPAVEQGQLLLLVFDIGIADGARFDGPADGVRFEVELEDRKVFAKDWRECRWQAQAVDLSPFAGRRVSLTLLTDAIKNTSYDWAVWGNPRVLWFRGVSDLKTNAPGKVSIPITTGALALRSGATNGLKVFLKSDSSVAPVEWPISSSASAEHSDAWAVRDFRFPHGRQVELDWEPRDAPVNLYAAAYPPRTKLTLVSATRSVVSSEENVPIRIQVRNDGRGQQDEGSATVQVQIGGQSLPARALPALGPGEQWQGEWDWHAPGKPGSYALTARLSTPDHSEELKGLLEVFRPATRVARIQNRAMKLEFVRQPDGFAYGNVFARQSNHWMQVAVWRPLFQIMSDAPDSGRTWEIRPVEAHRSSGRENRSGQSIEFAGKSRDADNVEWRGKLQVTLDAERPIARLHYEWAVVRTRAIRRLLGPNIYVGDGTVGEAKSWGMFPGLEYLFGAERSSNPRDFAINLADRRTPHPHKVTVPLMAVSVGPASPAPPEKEERFFAPDSLKDQPLSKAITRQTSNDRSEITVALAWNPTQQWDGEHAFPSARFASPNVDEGMRNHRLALFLPSTPEFVPENGDTAAQSYLLEAGKPLKLDAALVVAPGPVNVALREWLRETGGLPKPNPRPRSFQQELDVCRAGFLNTVWDERNEKWRHVIGGGSSHAPGFAALLWLDAHLAESAEARRQSRERVELAVQNMLRDGGPASLTSQANCHIMQWELPFYSGFLPEAMVGLEAQIKNLIQMQRPDGGWIYQPANQAQADLGQQGDSVLGTCAQHAAALLRFARVTGDLAALRAGEKALEFMERFRVPRGGQTWECPMYEPDILAAAYAVRAYHDGYRSTGNPRWLHDAVYWAESGLPFLYLWTLPDKPMMLGATIPVFGSTFYTHSWLAVPVQWCGLVYAYHVHHLAKELEHTPLKATDSPLPLALNFSPLDWNRVVELITVSAMDQQFDRGERVGTYPDSISQFEKRNPVYINPEDILVNALALEGRDPDIKTSRIKSGQGDIVISSVAEISDCRATPAGARWRLRFFPGEPCHNLIVGPKPRSVLIDGKPLEASAGPVRHSPGWWWDEERRRLYLTVLDEHATAEVEIVWQ